MAPLLPMPAAAPPTPLPRLLGDASRRRVLLSLLLLLLLLLLYPVLLVVRARLIDPSARCLII